MPDRIPPPRPTESQSKSSTRPLPDHTWDDSSDRFSTPVLVSNSSSRLASRTSSPFVQLPYPAESSRSRNTLHPGDQRGNRLSTDFGFEDWPQEDEDEGDMPSDLRPSLDRHADGRSHQPLLSSQGISGYDSPPRRTRHPSQRSTFHERDPEEESKHSTRKRYTYAAFFLVLSLISFVVQTETAVYIQHDLKWNKAYCMLYLTHGSWSLLWPTQLLILRLQKLHVPWHSFWRQHVTTLRQTAQMVQHRTLHITGRRATQSPVPYMLRTTVLVTCALTVAGGSWYVAVDYTTASDLTAIYNCSAFFAYAFSIPLLHEKLRCDKIVAVAVAIAGVLVVAYGDTSPVKHGNKSGGGAGGGNAPPSSEASNRTLGNIIIGIGSVLYGFYEVLYKRVACPPDGCSTGRAMIFANTFGSLIGCFTLSVLWIPLPFLHYMGWEIFELPQGKAASMMLISVLANATFSGSFLVLISLTSPVLSSVAALLTIFIVAIVDQLLPPPLYSPLTAAGIVGGCLIIGAFGLLSWSSYKEMNEERRKKMVDEIEESDLEE